MDESLQDRKKRHLEICLDPTAQIESGDTELGKIKLPHGSMPETDPSSVDLTTSFLNHRLQVPVMISCMTGGSDEGRKLNLLLAEAAGKLGIAIGTGSIRIMLRHPETRAHFLLKEVAPNIPVLANIGAAQLREYESSIIIEAARSIGADALYVHLNAAQEMFQSDGDDSLGGWYDGIRRLADIDTIPILVKETCAGISPLDGLKLLKAGVSYIDIAGSGGTDWVAVEALRSDSAMKETAESFRGWGYSTAELLLAYRQIARAGGDSGRLTENRIIASGGLRTSGDFVRALSTGAILGAAALPFIRTAHQDGIDGVSAYVESLEIGIRSAVVLSGSRSLEGLRHLSLRVPPDLADRAEDLAEQATGSIGEEL